MYQLDACYPTSEPIRNRLEFQMMKSGGLSNCMIQLSIQTLVRRCFYWGECQLKFPWTCWSLVVWWRFTSKYSVVGTWFHIIFAFSVDQRPCNQTSERLKSCMRFNVHWVQHSWQQQHQASIEKKLPLSKYVLYLYPLLIARRPNYKYEPTDNVHVRSCSHPTKLILPVTDIIYVWLYTLSSDDWSTTGHVKYSPRKTQH